MTPAPDPAFLASFLNTSRIRKVVLLSGRFWGRPGRSSASKGECYGGYGILPEVQEEGRHQGPAAHHDEEREARHHGNLSDLRDEDLQDRQSITERHSN